MVSRELLVFEKMDGSIKELDNFTECLNSIRRRHLDIVPTMAQAIFKLNNINNSEGVTETVQYFLDRLYTNRYSHSNNKVQYQLLTVQTIHDGIKAFK